MKCIYIAGPFRARDGWELTRNVNRAEQMAYNVCNLGGVVALCPHTMFKNFDRTMDDKFWIDATMELLRRSDAVMVCSGWQDSEGTKGEIAEARKRNMPLFFDFNDLINWVDTPSIGTMSTKGDSRSWVEGTLTGRTSSTAMMTEAIGSTNAENGPRSSGKKSIG